MSDQHCRPVGKGRWGRGCGPGKAKREKNQTLPGGLGSARQSLLSSDLGCFRDLALSLPEGEGQDSQVARLQEVDPVPALVIVKLNTLLE